MNEAPTMLEEAGMIPIPLSTAQVLEHRGITPEEIAQKYTYSIEIAGQMTTDISIKGIRHLATLASISIDECVILEETDEWIRVQATATDPQGSKHHGVSQETKKTPNGKDKPFYIQNAFGKAQRNAAKGLLPTELLLAAIAKATGKPVIPELEAKLEIARETYKNQQSEINELKEQIEALKIENGELKGADIPHPEETEPESESGSESEIPMKEQDEIKF